MFRLIHYTKLNNMTIYYLERRFPVDILELFMWLDFAASNGFVRQNKFIFYNGVSYVFAPNNR